MVKAECVYSPQNYVCAVTGQCYIFGADTIDGIIEEMHDRLSSNGFDLWDYPLSEIGHIAENDINVVLVELTGEDEAGEWKTVLRWFEVPEQFSVEEE